MSAKSKKKMQMKWKMKFKQSKIIKPEIPKQQEVKEQKSFDEIRIRIASPDIIRSWSRGEVKKPETINYRSFKPEKDGLFCERIFGPTKDWECFCGKYKRMKHKDIVCDRCGVEVTLSRVRRERMAHIELTSPVVHIWFLRSVPSRIAYLLDIPIRDLERVTYYESYMVTESGKSPYKKCTLLGEEEYKKAKEEYGSSFKAGIGAGVIKDLLHNIEIEKLSKELREKMKQTDSVQKKKEIVKRLKIIEAFRKSGNKPEWMVLECVPVIPPDLRPLVPLDGGRFASSDLNDLYRRVINRNNRLKRLIELQAPDIIIHNEKRMLQEAVDALFDNGRRGKPVRGHGNRPLKSLADMLKGKQGRFRQNLLGKRVDYSGRSVIVVGPELKLYQCGLPKKMALELFKPFIIKKLEERGFVTTAKSAKRIVEKVRPEVWDILEEVIKEHPVLLNRAPTLHRQGIQAFEPILIEGKAIRVHPLVCAAFNADFDGDQMAVHVPLSSEAQIESRVIILSTNNIFSTASGKPLTAPTQDIVLGVYYLTKARGNQGTQPTMPLAGDRLAGKGEQALKVFSSPDEVLLALDFNEVGLNDSIKVRIKGKLYTTTAGRVIFNSVLPADYPYLNKNMNKKEISNLVEDCFHKYGRYQTIILLDALKNLGFKYATIAGITVCVDDMSIPQKKKELIKQAIHEVGEIQNQYKKGIITYGERYNKIIDLWTHVTDKVAENMMEGLKIEREGFNPVYMMADSGSRGNKLQIRQLAGMRGLMAKPQQRIVGSVGEIIEHPILSNFREGLSVLEYFISTHGARKGLADTALKTADAGYLTRRLVDVAQDVIITADDCGTLNGIYIGAIKEGADIMESVSERVVGRVVLDNVVDVATDEIVVKANQVIDRETAKKIEDLGIERIRIRSVLTCELRHGVCAKCYGWDLSKSSLVQVGEAVGVIAAQSIGEPGTQLTLRTFHIGGTASRMVEQSKIEVKQSGIVKFENLKAIKNRNGEVIVVNRNALALIIDENGRERETNNLPYGAILEVSEKQKVKEGQTIAKWDLYTVPIFTKGTGRVKFKDIVENVTYREEVDSTTGLIAHVIIEYREEKLQPRIIIVDSSDNELEVHHLPTEARIAVSDGDKVHGGDILAKIPREISKTRDITGGLPRVAELFEARKPKDHAIITEIDGIVKIGEISKGLRRILVKYESGIEKEYFAPQGKHLIAQNDDRVLAGDPLTDGPINPHDILRVKGERATQEYLVEKVQEVYRLQGVAINDKQIEVIVRQMLRWVKVENPGDTEFLVGQQVDKFTFKDENEKALKKKGKPSIGSPVLLGITKASLSTESFISAASFQETTRILTEAAVYGKTDKLTGLKENVIIGHLIPAGSGIDKYRKIEVKDKTFKLEEAQEKSEKIIKEETLA